MPPELPQLVLLLFVGAMAIVGYEMRDALRAPSCAQCPHCRQARRLAEETQRSYDDWYDRRTRPRDRDDDHRI